MQINRMPDPGSAVPPLREHVVVIGVASGPAILHQLEPKLLRHVVVVRRQRRPDLTDDGTALQRAMKQRRLAEAQVPRVESAQRIEKASPDDAVGTERENAGRERAPLMTIVVHRDQAPERRYGVIEPRRPRDIAAGIAQEVLFDQRAAIFVQHRVPFAEE